jgi:hypothetical protein
MTWYLATVVGNNKIDYDKNCRQIAGNLDHLADVVVQRGAHCPMEHIQSYTGSHWIPPLGKCLHHIAPAAAMVDINFENTQHINKTQLLASNNSTNQPLVVYGKCTP